MKTEERTLLLAVADALCVFLKERLDNRIGAHNYEEKVALGPYKALIEAVRELQPEG